MSFILSIETSSIDCSVAIHDSGEHLSSLSVSLAKSHSNLLLTLVDQAISNADISLKDLDAFAYSSGPGSYTGLRIGLSTLKGLCYSLSKPLIAVNTLQVMAQKAIDFYHDDVLYVPLIDARRMEVYTACFKSDLGLIKKPYAAVVDSSFADDLLAHNKVLFFGSGQNKLIKALSNPNALFLTNFRFNASDIGKLAHKAFNNSEFENIAFSEPFYLKKFYTTVSMKN